MIAYTKTHWSSLRTYEPIKSRSTDRCWLKRNQQASSWNIRAGGECKRPGDHRTFGRFDAGRALCAACHSRLFPADTMVKSASVLGRWTLRPSRSFGQQLPYGQGKAFVTYRDSGRKRPSYERWNRSTRRRSRLWKTACAIFWRFNAAAFWSELSRPGWWRPYCFAVSRDGRASRNSAVGGREFCAAHEIVEIDPYLSSFE